MVCRFLDSFDYYTSDDEMGRKWTSVTQPSFVAIISSPVRTGIGALRLSSGLGAVIKTIDSQGSWIVGFALQTSAFSGTLEILQFIDSATVQCTLRINANGTLEVLRSTATAVTGGLSTFSISANTWYHIEMKVTIADSIGADTCKVRVNEVDVITVDTGQDLKMSANATADIIKLICGSNVILYFDDLYVFDGTGSENNDFAGDVQVAAQFPDGNGTTSDFTGSDADSVDNYLHVDETDTDDDTSYVESSTATDIDLYNFANLAATPDTIHAVQVNVVSKKVDAGSRTMRIVTRPVATNFFGSSISPSAGSYTNEIKVYDLNPELSVAWTESTFNATEFGIEVET